jgi:signal transduction histidine kinase
MATAVRKVANRARPRNQTRRTAADMRAGDTATRVASMPVSDHYFRNMVRSMRTGVIAIKADGRVAAMNPVAYRTLSLKPRASDIGRHYSRVLAKHRDVTRILTSAFELSHLPNRAELRLKTLGRVIGYTLSHILDERGRLQGAVLFFKDLTRVEQLEERERLRDRLAALGEMAAAIAHEVKNPLAGIEVMAGVLRRQLTDSTDAQGILKDIISEAKMANAIVLEVLEFVRPIRLEVEPIVLADVLRDAVTMAESQSSHGAIPVDLILPAALPRIDGDPHQLRQLFVNLLTNAFEALGQHGRVEIRGHTAQVELDSSVADPVQRVPFVVIDVADNGPGVPPEIADRIFSPFFTTKARGSGLGLAIVRKIVDAHDGQIDVAARPEGGTCFTVTLPVSRQREWFQLAG